MIVQLQKPRVKNNKSIEGRKGRKMGGGHAIGIDLGATHVRAVLSDEKGHFFAKLREGTDKRSERAICDQIVRMSCRLCEETRLKMRGLKGVCIASAGPLSLKRGALVNATNFPFRYIPIVKPVRNRLKIPVCMLNDCTVSVIGEREFGAGGGMDNLAYITLGTGIGCGVYVDGHVLMGEDGKAAEVGHFVINPAGGLRCGCGKTGHWESYCSGRNIPNFVRAKLEGIDGRKVRKSLLFELAGGDLSNLSAETLFKAARDKDELSLEIVEEMGKLNAAGFANVIEAYDPSLITVGGSVALKGEELVMDPIRRYLKRYVARRLPKVMITPLGEDVGLYGAVVTIFNR